MSRGGSLRHRAPPRTRVCGTRRAVLGTWGTYVVSSNGRLGARGVVPRGRIRPRSRRQRHGRKPAHSSRQEHPHRDPGDRPPDGAWHPIDRGFHKAVRERSTRRWLPTVSRTSGGTEGVYRVMQRPLFPESLCFGRRQSRHPAMGGFLGSSAVERIGRTPVQMGPPHLNGVRR
jgi:hypothetical protein